MAECFGIFFHIQISPIHSAFFCFKGILCPKSRSQKHQKANVILNLPKMPPKFMKVSYKGKMGRKGRCLYTSIETSLLIGVYISTSTSGASIDTIKLYLTVELYFSNFLRVLYHPDTG